MTKKRVLWAIAFMVVAVTAYSGNQVISFSKNLTLVPQSKHEQNDKSHYKLNANYPQLESTALDNQSKSFNQAMEKIINEEITEFKKQVINNSAAARRLPKDVATNELHIDYKANAFKVDGQTIIGVRFNEEVYFAGAAHPNHTMEVFNYNLTTGKEIRVADVFKSDSKYLDVLAKISRQELPNKIQNDDSKMMIEGTEPKTENFKNWTLQADGILITFDEYQVAPYVFGQPEVLVSYSALSNVLVPESPLVGCAAPGICEAIS